MKFACHREPLQLDGLVARRVELRLRVVLGSLIVAWALWRRRIVPVWSPVAIVLGTILNFLADGAALSSIALSSQLVGFGWLGLRLIGTGE